MCELVVEDGEQYDMSRVEDDEEDQTLDRSNAQREVASHVEPKRETTFDRSPLQVLPLCLYTSIV